MCIGNTYITRRVICAREPGLEVYRGRPVLQQPSVVKGHCDTRARVVVVPLVSLPRPPLFLFPVSPREREGIANKSLFIHVRYARRPSLLYLCSSLKFILRSKNNSQLFTSSICYIDKLENIDKLEFLERWYHWRRFCFFFYLNRTRPRCLFRVANDRCQYYF